VWPATAKRRAWFDLSVRAVCEHVFVRWENLESRAEDERQLPGYSEAAVVRRFEAPEALDMRFYEIRARSVLNRVPKGSPAPFRWTVNPYRGCSHACVYCFARSTHAYLGFDAGRDFEREIVVKVNAPEVLRAELARPRWNHELVALGTNTDPYQWVEARYKLMPGIWEAMIDSGTPGSVLTKSPLLLRDLALLKRLHDRAGMHANLSVPTLDERAWRATEPHTPHPRARLEAVAELNRAGIPCGILVAPLMPGINDAPEQILPLLEAAEEAGAVGITGLGLHLRAGVREVFMEWLQAERPELVGRYRDLYRRGAYLAPSERRRLARLTPGRPVRDRLRDGSEAPAPGTTQPQPRAALRAAQEPLFGSP
jgi:DNA repair photolyase